MKRFAPGECIMIYTSGKRTRLLNDNPYLEAMEVRQHLENLPGKWDFNGISARRIVKTSENCPIKLKIILYWQSMGQKITGH